MTIRSGKIRLGLMAGLALVSFAGFSGVVEAAYCREYTKTIRIAGHLEQGYGRACQQPDGAWEIVSLNGSDAVQGAVRVDIRQDLGDDFPRVVVVDPFVSVYERPVYYRPYYRPVHFVPPVRPFCPPRWHGRGFHESHEWRRLGHEEERRHGGHVFRHEQR